MRAFRWGIGALGEVLVTAGMVLLLFVAWQLWWTDIAANKAQHGTVSALERDFRGAGGVQPPPVAMGKAFAILRIPRFGEDYARPVFEGTDHDTLQKGVGHYLGTGRPGRVGNFALAGHRTTYGRPFHNIDILQTGDRIIVETKTGYSVYAVARHVIVLPSQTEVIAPVPQHPGQRPTQAWLTMTACHPKFSAKQRYVVFAKLLHTYTHTEGVPASDLSVQGGAA